MKGILYYLVYSLLWLITFLPLGILYGLSDFFFVLIYYVVGYRKKTVFTNLSRSFPGFSPEKIRRIARTSYRQLTDYFIEWMYRIHMGDKELSRRMYFKNPEILQEYYKQGISIMLLLSHHGNWEWPTRISLYSGHKVLAIYKPLQNIYFDRLFRNLRSKFGAVGVPMESTLRSIIEHHKNKQPVIVYTLADQRPQYRSIQHWTHFMNQDTPVITGPEKIAQKFEMTTLFLAIDKIKRGYYEAEFQVINENSSKQREFEITCKYLNALEYIVNKKPELYLWTHKRWKYKRTDTKNPVDIPRL